MRAAAHRVFEVVPGGFFSRVDVDRREHELERREGRADRGTDRVRAVGSGVTGGI